MASKSNYTCKVCDKIFLNRSEFLKHWWSAHKPKDTSHYGRGTIRYTCKQCGEKFPNKALMANHVRYKHPKNKSKELVPVVKLNGGAHKSDMLVSELLEKLKSQRNFMVDVVNLIEGLAKSNS